MRDEDECWGKLFNPSAIPSVNLLALNQMRRLCSHPTSTRSSSDIFVTVVGSTVTCKAMVMVTWTDQPELPLEIWREKKISKVNKSLMLSNFTHFAADLSRVTAVAP